MSLFIRENPLIKRNNNSLLRNSFFDDDFDNEFFNHPLISFPSIYPFYHNNHPLNALQNQIEKAFNSDVFKTVDFSPKINLSEDEMNYYIHADLPGLNKNQVKMELSDDNRILTISGERETIIDNSEDNNKENNKENNKKNKKDNTNENKEVENEETKHENSKEETNKKENTKKYSRIECSYGKFSRSFTLPENADINNIQAKMENGVLEVNLPKIEPQKTEQKKTIQIQ